MLWGAGSSKWERLTALLSYRVQVQGILRGKSNGPKTRVRWDLSRPWIDPFLHGLSPSPVHSLCQIMKVPPPLLRPTPRPLHFSPGLPFYLNHSLPAYSPTHSTHCSQNCTDGALFTNFRSSAPPIAVFPKVTDTLGDTMMWHYSISKLLTFGSLPISLIE